MPLRKGTCSSCGVPLEIAVPEPLREAALVAPLCSACTDQLFLENDGAVLRWRRELEGARFPLGKVTITPGAVAALSEAGQHATAFLVRHVRGDWGEFGQCAQRVRRFRFSVRPPPEKLPLRGERGMVEYLGIQSSRRPAGAETAGSQLPKAEK